MKTPRGTAFIDPYGFMKKEGTGRLRSRATIERMEREIKDYLDQGASISEAVYCIHAVLETAVGNIRHELLEGHRALKHRRTDMRSKRR